MFGPGTSGGSLVLLLFGAIVALAFAVAIAWAIVDIIRLEVRKASERRHDRSPR